MEIFRKPMVQSNVCFGSNAGQELVKKRKEIIRQLGILESVTGEGKNNVLLGEKLDQLQGKFQQIGSELQPDEKLEPKENAAIKSFSYFIDKLEGLLRKKKFGDKDILIEKIKLVKAEMLLLQTKGPKL